jgi:hypothetical protein
MGKFREEKEQGLEREFDWALKRDRDFQLV